ncbi:hypothetical protein ABEB36_000627 [Hypothenemus hampei]|uniref:Odorant receptor n=1 Tax=Hypothenemus hampei TaxID=57062 RepID=A0ABD1FBW2_HYPHA
MFNTVISVFSVFFIRLFIMYTVLNTNLLQSKTTKVFFVLSDKFKEIFMPNVNDMEPELKRAVNSLSLKVELFVLYFWACTLITIIMILYDLCFYEDRLLLRTILSKGSFLYQIVRIVVCCFFVFTSIPSVFVPMQLIVVIFHSQIQVLQLLDKIKKFEKKISNEHVDNQRILKNLKIFGQHHLDIKSFHYNAFKATQLYSTIYSTTGLVLGISSLIAMFSSSINEIQIFGILCSPVSFSFDLEFFIPCFFLVLKHLSDALYNLKWYMWAAKCQKFHLLLIGQVAQEFKIPILFLLHVDFELIKRFLKIIYTATNCLITLRQKN